MIFLIFKQEEVAAVAAVEVWLITLLLETLDQEVKVLLEVTQEVMVGKVVQHKNLVTPMLVIVEMLALSMQAAEVVAQAAVEEYSLMDQVEEVKTEVLEVVAR